MRQQPGIFYSIRSNAHTQYAKQERRIQELEGQLADAAQQLDATRSLRAVSQDALDQARCVQMTVSVYDCAR